MSPSNPLLTPLQDTPNQSESSLNFDPQMNQDLAADQSTSNTSQKGDRFSFSWFFLVFWLTVIATIVVSWNMVSSL